MKNIIYFLVAVFVFSCEKNNNPDEKNGFSYSMAKT